MRKAEKSFSGRGVGKLHTRSLPYKTSLALLAVLIVLASAAILWNASNLRDAINRRTTVYVGDVSLQLADDVDYRLSKNILDLEILADTLQRMDNDRTIASVQSFLSRKASALGFTSLVLIDEEGRRCYSTPFEGDLLSQPGVISSFAGQSGVSFLDKESILYSIPIYKEKRVAGVLAGVRSKENMQKLIEPKSFSGQGITCIIDIDGNVVISPTDLDPFLQLDDIFSQHESGPLVENILQMQANMHNRQSGIFSFTAVDGTELVLSYHPLTSYDWVLLTLVPSNLISHETDFYINQNFLIIAGTILLFAVILFAFYHLYRSHSRELERIAFVDQLTGGQNNASFQIDCGRLLQGMKPSNCAVALMNIRNFKLINANYGSAEGDNTLRNVMQALRRSIRDDELAARADADNFFLLLQEKDPAVIQQRLSAMAEEARSLNPYHLTLYAGVYIVDDPSLEITLIQDRAKTACRSRTVQEGELCGFYDSSLTQQLQMEYELNELFETSLTNGDFKAFLQPKVWLESGEIGGAEALVRWHHPERGVIFPSDFIPLFEKNGKICKLDLFIFEEVCKTLRRWMEEGRAVFPISVNLSRQHFKRPDCLCPFEEIAGRYGIPRGLIELELTESILFDDQSIELVKEQTREMHRKGFLCSLDDFGAGYSSLGLLMEFDIDVVKLDRRFFLNVEQPKTRDVVASIVELARKIGAKTVAEGIETPEQLDFLCGVHCDMVQGYIFSRPLPIDEFELWLSSRKPAALPNG